MSACGAEFTHPDTQTRTAARSSSMLARKSVTQKVPFTTNLQAEPLKYAV